MAENLDLNIKVNTSEAEASVGSLKKQLREAQNEVNALSEKFGDTSKEAINAAKRAAELKDRIGDAKSLTDAFNPDAKFKALTSSLSGVAGGFGAVQGAMALFGAESDNVQKTLLKVQSAMAVSQGLQSIGESVDSFKQLGAVIKSTTIFQRANEMANKAAAFSLKTLGITAEVTSTSFRVMKTAIAATGIGLLVIGLGEAVAAFQRFQSSAEDAADAQRKLNESALKYADSALKAEQNFLDKQQKINVSKAKLAGKSESEIFEIEQGFRRQKIESLRRHYVEVGDANTEARQKDLEEIDRLNTDGIVARNEFNAKIIKQNEEKNKQLQEQNKLSDEKEKQLQKEKDAAELDASERIIKLKNEIEVLGIEDEYKAKRTAIDQQLLLDIAQVNNNENLKAETKKALVIELGNKANADIEKINKEQFDEQAKKDKEALLKKQEEERGIRLIGLQGKIEDIDREIAKKDQDFEADKERFEAKMEILDEQKIIELSNLELNEFERNEILKKYSDLRKGIVNDELENDKKAQEAKLALQMSVFDATSGLVSGLGSLFEQGSAESKTAALADIAINTAKGYVQGLDIAQKGAQAAGPAAPFAFPIFYATQIAAVLGAVAKARGILATTKGGSGGGGGMPSMSASAPIAPSIPTAQTTNISQQSINDMGNQAIKAYVIESDVTNNQQRIEAIRQRARFS
jgi:hypothetical protein